MSRKEDFTRRDFLWLTGYGLLGLFFPDLSNVVPGPAGSYPLPRPICETDWEEMYFQLSQTERKILRQLPTPDNQLLVKIVDKSHPVSEKFIEYKIVPNLIKLKEINGQLKHRYQLKSDRLAVHSVMETDLLKMAEECSVQKIVLGIGDAFRNLEAQAIAFSQVNGDEEFVMRPGHSQHQLGLAIDFTTRKLEMQIGSKVGFENSDEYAWLMDSGHRFGFVQPFINRHDGVHQEPWHWVYVGKSIAEFHFKIRQQGWDGDIFDLQKLYEIKQSFIPNHRGLTPFENGEVCRE